MSATDWQSLMTAVNSVGHNVEPRITPVSTRESDDLHPHNNIH